MDKRVIHLKDQSSADTTRIIVWKNHATSWSHAENSIIAIKKIALGRFKGMFHHSKTPIMVLMIKERLFLSFRPGTVIIPDPSGPEADALRDCFSLSRSVREEPTHYVRSSPERDVSAVTTIPTSDVSTIAQVNATSFARDQEPAPEFCVIVESIFLDQTKRLAVETCPQCPGGKTVVFDDQSDSWRCRSGHSQKQPSFR
jgi:hypothetical protein